MTSSGSSGCSNRSCLGSREEYSGLFWLFQARWCGKWWHRARRKLGRCNPGAPYEALCSWVERAGSGKAGTEGRWDPPDSGVSGKIPLRVSHLSYFSFFMALNVPAAGNCRGRGFLEKPGSVWGQYLSPPFPRLRTICAFAACAGDKRRAPCLQRLVGITGITVPFLWLPRYDQVSENPLGAAPPEPCKHHSLLSRATVIKDK